jgi:hypothetical protein
LWTGITTETAGAGWAAEAFRRDSHRVMDVTRRTPAALGSGDDAAGVPLGRMG